MSKYAIFGGLLIDGNGGEPISNSLVLIDEEKITYAGKDDGTRNGYINIDATGKTIIPGLIDTHVHYGGLLSDEVRDWVLEPPLQKAILSVKEAQLTLKRGVTTVGDMSENGIHLRNMIDGGHMQGPRIIETGRGFCRSGGHSTSTTVPNELNHNNHPWAEQVDGPWEIRKAIRNRIRQRPDAFKIWTTGGGLNPLDRREDLNYTYEEIEAAVDEANLINLPMWAHAENALGALYSCKAGVWALIHGESLDDECLQLMVEKDIFLCATIRLFHTLFERPDYNIADKDDLGEGGLNAHEIEYNRINANLMKAVNLGIRVTVGSDSFCEYALPYGTAAIEEMYAFKIAGMSEMQIMVAATKNGAEMLKVDDITGTLEPGKMADLVVVTENPLEDIQNLKVENMEIIMKEGVQIL